MFSSLTNNISAMDQDVGYCPQFDALDSRLTGVEMLFFYARLKGIPSDDISAVRICFSRPESPQRRQDEKMGL